MGNRLYIFQLKRSRNKILRDYDWNIRHGYNSLAQDSVKALDELTRRIEELEQPCAK